VFFHALLIFGFLNSFELGFSTPVDSLDSFFLWPCRTFISLCIWVVVGFVVSGDKQEKSRRRFVVEWAIFWVLIFQNLRKNSICDYSDFFLLLCFHSP
jgi:hypothetical protein